MSSKNQILVIPQGTGGGGGGAVDSVNGQTGTVVLTKSDINLGNVDNTSDANKPVSTAQEAAFIRQDGTSPATTGKVKIGNNQGFETGTNAAIDPNNVNAEINFGVNTPYRYVQVFSSDQHNLYNNRSSGFSSNLMMNAGGFHLNATNGSESVLIESESTGSALVRSTASVKLSGQDGIKLNTNALIPFGAVLKADNIATTDKTIQIPNESGQFGLAPVPVYANKTAVKGISYIVLANATFTDPASPTNGDSYEVTVGAGTAIVGGVSYSIAGTVIKRIRVAGAWVNEVYQNKLEAIVPSLSKIVAGDGFQEAVNKITGELNRPKKQGTYSNKKPVAFGNRFPYISNLSNGTDTTATSRMKFVSHYNISDLSLIFQNFEHILQFSILASNDITIESSIEYPAGTFTRITFNKGNNSFLLRKGQSIETDTVNIKIPSNTIFWVRTNVLVGAGERWLNNKTTQPTYNEGAVIGTNSVVSGTITDSNTFVYAPSLILGTYSDYKKAVLVVGDSISIGQGDSGQPVRGASIAGGIFMRVLDNTYPMIMANISGCSLTNWLSSLNMYRQDPFLSAVDAVFCNLGVNDVTSGSSEANIKNLYLRLWLTFYSKGLPVYQTTITPVTTSTDGWITTANQTVTANEAKRLAINAWLRDGAPINELTQIPEATGATGSNVIRIGNFKHPVVRLFEVADTLETTRNSGIWKAGYTADGTHPNATGYTDAVLAVDASVLSF